MNFFKCPKRGDHKPLTEEEWRARDWSEEEIFRNAALPHHMWNQKHEDYFWPFCHKYRGDNAYGHRAGEGHPKYMPILPKLVEGRGIARWMTPGDTSVVEVPELADYDHLWTPHNMPFVIKFIERNPSHKDFGKQLAWSKKNFLREYAPTSLQKFSKRSMLRRDPHHYSFHYIVKRREIHGKSKSETGADIVLLYRSGWRWDSLDSYFVKGAIYLGLAWN